MQKSVGKNAVLNVMRTLITLVFPLITFPYIARVLQVENYGKVIYVNSILNYFVMFSLLGAKTYGTREGAALRENKEKFQDFFSQLLTINVIATVFSYSALFMMVAFVPAFKDYTQLFVVMSGMIILSSLGSEWVCMAYEDYGYITIRGILVQLLSFASTFVFVQTKEDYWKYGIILAFSTAGANLFNIFYIKKYVRFKLVRNLNLKKHIKPLLVLFASTLATTVYVSSDTTMLGMISGTYYTGLYGAATKIYSVIKNLVSAIVVVSIPRFSYYYLNGKQAEYDKLLQEISNVMLMLSVPASAGLFMLSKEVIFILSGEQYLEATKALQILSIAVIFIAISWIFSQCILIPMKLEKVVLYTTIGTALLNIVLNLFLIERLQHVATAITTLISEATVTLVYYYFIRKKVKFKNVMRHIRGVIIATVGMIITVMIIRRNISNDLGKIVISVIVGAIVYFAVLLGIKNQTVLSIKNQIVLKCTGKDLVTGYTKINKDSEQREKKM